MDIFSLISKKLVLERLVIGLKEPILIKGLGEITAKIDSGNGGLNVIHGDNFVLQGDTLLFDTKNDKGETRKLSKKVVGYIDVNIGGGNIQHRPIIELDIKFADTNYKKIKFSVTDRASNDTLILISKAFVQDELDALIDVSGENLTQDGKIEAQIVSEGLNDGRGIVGDGSNQGVNAKNKDAEKSAMGRIGDKIKGAGNVLDKATNVFAALRGKGGLIDAVSDFVNSLPGIDTVKELIASLNKDAYYKADKPKIKEALNRESAKLKEVNIDAKSNFKLIRVADFTGGGWNSSATETFQGKVPYNKLGDTLKNGSTKINESAFIENIILEALPQQPQQAQQPATPQQPAQNQNQGQNQVQNQGQNQSQQQDNGQNGDESKSEPDDVVKNFKNKITEKVKELKSNKVGLADFIDGFSGLKDEINSAQFKNDKDKKELLIAIDQHISGYASEKVKNTQNFIIYFVDFGTPDYKKVLENEILDANVLSALTSVYDGNEDSKQNIGNATSIILDNMSKNDNVKGCLALVTGNLSDRKATIMIPSSGAGSEAESEVDDTLDDILGDLELPGSDEKSDNEPKNIDTILDDILNKIELPNLSNKNNNDIESTIDNIIKNILLPELPGENNKKDNIDTILDDIIKNISLPGAADESNNNDEDKIHSLINSVKLPSLPENKENGAKQQTDNEKEQSADNAQTDNNEETATK